MANVSIWRKIYLYNQYRKTILSKKDILEENGLRIDKVKRLYTVVNIPEQLFDSTYDIRASDINRVSETYLVESARRVSKVLNSIGLNELYKSYETKKVGKYSYLVVLGFSLINTKKMADNLYFRIIPAIIVLAIVCLFLFYL